jgi:hypothetical protein
LLALAPPPPLFLDHTSPLANRWSEWCCGSYKEKSLAGPNLAINHASLHRTS